MIDQSSFTPDRLTNTEMYTETRTMRHDTETQIQINAQSCTYRQTDTQKRRTAVSLQNIKKSSGGLSKQLNTHGEAK